MTPNFLEQSIIKIVQKLIFCVDRYIQAWIYTHLNSLAKNNMVLLRLQSKLIYDYLWDNLFFVKLPFIITFCQSNLDVP